MALTAGVLLPIAAQRHIKYTPEHMHCLAAFYGPNTPPNTGLLCFQQERRKGFRVCATGVVRPAVA